MDKIDGGPKNLYIRWSRNGGAKLCLKHLLKKT